MAHSQPTPDSAPRAFDAAPTTGAERIRSLDVIRGVAVLGILAMNILFMALPSNSWSTPWQEGGPDLWVVCVQDVFFDGRMRGLFSMLFGAGALLFLDRLEARGAGLRAADLYYRRMLWLLLFGLVHAWVLLWPGDILYGYALCGLFLFPLRHAAPRRLALAGLLLLGVNSAQAFYEESRDRTRWELAVAADALHAEGAALDEEQESARTWRDERVAAFAGAVDPEERAQELATRRGSYAQVWRDAAPYSYERQGEGMYSDDVFDQLGAMLLGMALLRVGFLTGRGRRRVYAAAVGVGYGVVVPCVAYLDWLWFTTGAPPDAWGQMLVWEVSYPFARMAVALAHAGALVLLLRSGVATWLFTRLAATGRMALTHYVGQTVLCQLLIFGPAGKQFGVFSRAELVPIVLAIWVLQVAVSAPWLARYRFGPLEWLWRSLTYGERQPMRRGAGAGRTSLERAAAGGGGLSEVS